ncbi:MAG: cyclic nucleotide-binding domain-containing protein [Bdellovibrionaceae bacterium]|nr:cyclic nucleotide-binding domain-containing protein [Bdellovibrionales bacterium]MCB9254234.1 cyclic nucleotide-binding domain-containing protein [Pseudobdellovibrionaceae bacterium]
MSSPKGLTPFRKIFPEGHTLLKEGETGTSFYILERGTLEIRVKGKAINTITASDELEFVGEVAALLDTPRTATVIAKTEISVLYFEAGNFEKIIGAAPTLGMKLARSLAKKLSALQSPTKKAA